MKAARWRSGPTVSRQVPWTEVTRSVTAEWFCERRGCYAGLRYGRSPIALWVPLHDARAAADHEAGEPHLLNKVSQRLSKGLS
jgi:hypothetical protein